MQTSPLTTGPDRTITRRHFLKTTAVGVAAFSCGIVLGANERVGVGVIGFGLIASVSDLSSPS